MPRNELDNHDIAPATATTPGKNSLSIKTFLKKLDIQGSPRFVPFTWRSDTYLAGNCLSNCEAESGNSGSRVMYGWTVWENKPHRILIAEFHAVLLERGLLVDITPRIDGETRIMFVPDPKRSASRIDATTWETWGPGKSESGRIIEHIRPILIVKTP